MLETVVELDADVVVLGGKQKRGLQRLREFILPNGRVSTSISAGVRL